MTTLPLNSEERWCAGRKFARSMHLEHIEVYWVPSIRGIIVRSINATRIFRLPAGSISVGVYAQPFKTEDFLNDLEDVLAKLAATRTADHDEALIASAAPAP
jgi:hypothetical protein